MIRAKLEAVYPLPLLFLFLLFVGFLLFFLPAYGRKVELPLLILDNVDYRLVQDHLTDLDFLSKDRKQLHIHLKVLSSNERLLSKSRIIVDGNLLETTTDTT